MDTITQDREALRVPSPRQPASGPFRAHPAGRGGSVQTAQTAQATTALRPMPGRPTSLPPNSGRAVQAPIAPRPAPGRSAADKSAADRSAAEGAAAGQLAGPRRLRAAEQAGQVVGTAKLRMRFALLILVLLSGGLICLLVINTTLGATSFRISQLQSANATLATQQQALQQQIAAELSPALVARRAYDLGMRVQQYGNILDLRTHRIDKLATQQGATVPLGSGP